jgi:hypothetical protein
MYVLNCHENYLESYILSQSTRSFTINILSCIIENLEALEIAKIILTPLRQHCKVVMYIFGYVVLFLIAIIDLFVIPPWESKLNEFGVSVLFLFIKGVFFLHLRRSWR